MRRRFWGAARVGRERGKRKCQDKSKIMMVVVAVVEREMSWFWKGGGGSVEGVVCTVQLVGRYDTRV